MNVLQSLIAEERRQDRAAVRAFVDAVRTADAGRCFDSFEGLDHRVMWRSAMRAIAKVPCTSDGFRLGFLEVWISSGDHIRNEVGNDLILVDGLRALLPPYTGKALTLHRGDSAWNARRRTLGLSWTATADVARAFAQGPLWRSFEGGSVLLEAHAPPEAIICAPALVADDYEESEYIVDRRRLTSIKIIERFSHLPPGAG